MINKKVLAFVSSIIEIVLAVVLFITSMATLAHFLSSLNSFDTTSAVLTIVVTFALLVVFIVDGIISLRVSKADEEVYNGFLGSYIAMGVVELILAILALFTFALFYYFSGVIILFSFFILIIIGTLKIVSGIRGVAEPSAEDIVETKGAVNVKKKENLEDTLKKLDGLAKLQSEGLISSEEFEEMKAEILDKKD